MIFCSNGEIGKTEQAVAFGFCVRLGFWVEAFGGKGNHGFDDVEPDRNVEPDHDLKDPFDDLEVSAQFQHLLSEPDRDLYVVDDPNGIDDEVLGLDVPKGEPFAHGPGPFSDVDVRRDSLTYVDIR